MTAEKTRWRRFGLVAIACSCLVMGSGFMACGSGDEVNTDATGAGGAGGTNGSCVVAQCPDPPFVGMEKCCTTNGLCGLRSGAASTCYPPGQSGSGGAGGMGGGKL